MANKEHVATLKEGASLWNPWRRQNPKIVPDLRAANLRGAELIGSHLSDVRLNKADLRRADLGLAILSGAELSAAELSGTSFAGATLSGADLSGADLTNANLNGADLRGSNLRRVRLGLANLSGANLGDADLSGAKFGFTIFGDNDLSSTKGLETVKHDGPSTIGIDTIYASQGKIPEAFLRGCGVPENFITYMPSLVAPGAIQFYSCFISYSTKDQEFADRLYADLQNKGVRCWFAPHDIQGGKPLDDQIDAAIRVHEKVLLILSPASIQSDWVHHEVGKARDREAKEKKRVLFPVRLVGHEKVLKALRDWSLYRGKDGKKSAEEIRRFYIPDFSEWKQHDSYAREFEKLLRDLRVEG